MISKIGIRSLLGCLVLLLIGMLQAMPLARAAQDDRDVDHVGRHTPVNTEVLIRAHAQWTKDCAAQAPPELDVTVPPQHGHISMRAGTAPLGTNAVGGTSCTGRTGVATLIFYQPDVDYHGHDTLTYQVHYQGNSIRTIEARIRVD